MVWAGCYSLMGSMAIQWPDDVTPMGPPKKAICMKKTIEFKGFSHLPASSTCSTSKHNNPGSES